MKTLRTTIAATLSATTLLAAAPFAAQAQGGFLHRHPVASSIAAGMAAHHMAKHGMHARAASGRRGNFAERHPIMSGLGAAAVTHHMLKHH